MAAALGAACSGDPGPTPAATGSPQASPPPVVRCDVPPGRPPPGFVLARERRRTYPDRLGLHRTLRAPDGRRLDYLLGAAGEIGEGLPLVARLPLATGTEARLVGRGDTWLLVWEGAPPCLRNAIIGNRMTRAGFLRVLGKTGLVTDRGGR